MATNHDMKRETPQAFLDPADYHFPTDHLQIQQDGEHKTPLVLVVCGSFSPITIMHLRMCEMASDWVRTVEDAFEVVGIYLSPVSDAYRKAGLAEARHRIRMCQLAVDEAPGIVMVDPWEASQANYIPTANVLDHFDHEINEVLGGIPDQHGVRRKARISLLAGSDLLATMSTPGVWSQDDLEKILGKGGMYVVERQGTDVQDAKDRLPRWADKINIISQNVPIDLSSTKMRLFLKRGFSVKYFVPNAVIDYIKEHNLYPREIGPADGEQTGKDKQKMDGPSSSSVLSGA